MATLTIKIESDELAREVLTHMGYLPEDDIPDLVTDDEDTLVEPEEEEAPRLPRTEVEAIHERMKAPLLFPNPTRKMSEEPKQNEFCTVLEPNEGVEPVDNELGAPLEVYSDETKKERDELYQQCLEIRKTIPSAEERLKTQIEGLTESELLNHLDALADHDDPAMRKAVKAYVLKEYLRYPLKSWPALQKILDGNA
jgi:hypothetical protein